MEIEPDETRQKLNSLGKSVLLLKAAERCKVIEAHLVLARSELDMATIELRALRQQLQISPPLDNENQ